MKRTFYYILFSLFAYGIHAQTGSRPFEAEWQFRQAGKGPWYKAEVPGTVHTDLFASKLIEDPFYRDNESRLQWIEKQDWEYRCSFRADSILLHTSDLKLVFEGLDTYAKIYLNNELVLSADNMFRTWRLPLAGKLKKESNEIRIVFSSAVRHDDSIAAIYPLKLPGENSRMFSRKAQYQYGWDWGPRFVTCGIWRPVHWEFPAAPRLSPVKKSWNVVLVDSPDKDGRAFYFQKDGKPVYIKGANWIPCESFIPRARKKGLYRKLLLQAREAHINMLRVWGGGIYEEDEFYDLCDELGIMVWQDFMFAGAMYPVDKAFYDNVEQEVREQVTRLRDHPCIVLWCGNNEIEEGWNNWGWQKQLGLSADDSVRIWRGYERIFHSLIPDIIKELDPQRAYWPSSPSLGWGRPKAYKQGDVHYWGVWWGKEPVENYRNRIGRFNSEYGMQSLPSLQTIRQFAPENEWDSSSVSMKAHQKHGTGYQNIRTYIENKFPSPKNFSDLVYVSQLMQADAMKTAIEAHRSAMPYNMGTLFWQWNDCWPVVSWSAVDHFGRKKALFYQVKRSYADDFMSLSVSGDSLILLLQTSYTGKLSMMMKTFDRSGRPVNNAGAVTAISGEISRFAFPIDTQRAAMAWAEIKLGENSIENTLFISPQKELIPGKPNIQVKLVNEVLELTSDKLAIGTEIQVPDNVELSDNFFDLLPGIKKSIHISNHTNLPVTEKSIRIRSLADTY